MVEITKYEVTQEKATEIRIYPKIVIAKVEDPANGFNLLYRFIRAKIGKKQK